MAQRGILVVREAVIAETHQGFRAFRLPDAVQLGRMHLSRVTGCAGHRNLVVRMRNGNAFVGVGRCSAFVRVKVCHGYIAPWK